VPSFGAPIGTFLAIWIPKWHAPCWEGLGVSILEVSWSANPRSLYILKVPLSKSQPTNSSHLESQLVRFLLGEAHVPILEVPTLGVLFLKGSSLGVPIGERLESGGPFGTFLAILVGFSGCKALGITRDPCSVESVSEKVI
jgi:hypothetical protein